MTTSWSADVAIPGWWGADTAGLAAALWDLDGSGRLDLVVAWIDSPAGGNTIYYRIGRNLDNLGVATSWTPEIAVPGGVGDDSSGLGIALTDFAGNGLPDMAVFWIDDPEGPNNGRVRFGQDIDETGQPRRGWSGYRQVPGWWGSTSAGAGAASAPIRGLTRPDLVALDVDDPDGENRAYYRLLAPSLPSWNPVRPLAPVGASAPVNVARLARSRPRPT